MVEWRKAIKTKKQKKKKKRHEQEKEFNQFPCFFFIFWKEWLLVFIYISLGLKRIPAWNFERKREREQLFKQRELKTNNSNANGAFFWDKKGFKIKAMKLEFIV